MAVSEAEAMSWRRPTVHVWSFKGAVWTLAALWCALFWAAMYRLFIRLTASH